MTNRRSARGIGVKLEWSSDLSSDSPLSAIAPSATATTFTPPVVMAPTKCPRSQARKNEAKAKKSPKEIVKSAAERKAKKAARRQETPFAEVKFSPIAEVDDESETEVTEPKLFPSVEKDDESAIIVAESKSKKLARYDDTSIDEPQLVWSINEDDAESVYKPESDSETELHLQHKTKSNSRKRTLQDGESFQSNKRPKRESRTRYQEIQSDGDDESEPAKRPTRCPRHQPIPTPGEDSDSDDSPLSSPEPEKATPEELAEIATISNGFKLATGIESIVSSQPEEWLAGAQRLHADLSQTPGGADGFDDAVLEAIAEKVKKQQRMAAILKRGPDVAPGDGGDDDKFRAFRSWRFAKLFEAKPEMVAIYKTKAKTASYNSGWRKKVALYEMIALNPTYVLKVVEDLCLQDEQILGDRPLQEGDFSLREQLDAMDWYADNKYDEICGLHWDWREIPSKEMFEVEQGVMRSRG